MKTRMHDDSKAAKRLRFMIRKGNNFEKEI